jgi:hypothetical protein
MMSSSMCGDIASPLEDSLTVEPARADAGFELTCRRGMRAGWLFTRRRVAIFSYRAARGLVQLGVATDEGPPVQLLPTAAHSFRELNVVH